MAPRATAPGPARSMTIASMLLWAASVGCKPSPEPDPLPAPTAGRASPTTKPDEGGGETELAEQEQALRLLNEDALLARVQAQRALLGSGLFEDERGKPVAWISPQEELPEPETESLDDELLASLPGSSGLGGEEGRAATYTGPRVNGNALGLFEPIEQPVEGEALASFHGALRRLEAGSDPDGKVRVLLYGGSHTDADVYPHYVRTYLQERFGDGGHGFVQVAKPWRWYGHFDIAVEGLRRWKTHHAQYTNGVEDGMFGLLGAAMTTRSKKAFGRITHRSGTVGSHYEIWYLQQPRGGSFRVLVDGKPHGVVRTRAKEAAPGYYPIDLPPAEHSIEIQPVGNGEIRMFGMTVENDEPGVVVDTLGIGGTRAANMLRWNQALWAEHVQRRAPDLVALFYGTNEATDAHAPIEAYEADLREVMARFQEMAPQASCLLIGPGDFPMESEQGSLVPRPRIRQIVEVQRKVAAEIGCGFWDTLAFMGGELSMLRWANANPPMAKQDHIHFTRRGYVRLGMALVDAMMLEFDGGPSQFDAGTAVASP